jgi:GMP synthase (glutamine-hydrolysing)
VPKDCTLLATSDRYPNQAYRYGDNAYAAQFHPEVTPTIFQTWCKEAGDHLSKPGAHSAERQIADATLYDEAQRQWIERFIDIWLPS